jgi:hypothetical protein
MNKQFEKLMYDAGMTAQGCWDELDSYQRGAVEKFAKLIVKECIDQCIDDESQYFIAKYFGVEE